MSLSEIFSNSIKYPLNDYKAFLVVGIIGLLAGLTTVLKQFSVDNSAVAIIAAIISLVFSIILAGYVVDVIKKGIDNSDEVPYLDLAANLINGIKVIIISIVYEIIPLIIIFVLAVVTGAIGAGLNHVGTALLITVVVGLILAILFGIFNIVAIARFAESGNLSDALSIGEVIEKAKSIGIFKIIAFIIIAIVIIFIVGIIVGIIGLIPYIGLIIGTILSSGFIVLFYGKATGLLYADA